LRFAFFKKAIASKRIAMLERTFCKKKATENPIDNNNENT